MLEFLFRKREGQFLVIGTCFLILGFILSFAGSLWSRWAFYAAIFFLGFFATKDAVIDTVRNQSPNVDLLMILAALGAVVINYESEGAVLLFIFAGAEFLEEYATNKSTKAIEELMSQVPTTAQRLLDNGEVEEVATDELRLNDLVVVSKGGQVPIDGDCDRDALLNEAALTGESLPVEKQVGDKVFAGTLNEGNAFHLKVTKLASETMFSNIIRMVEEAQGRPSKISSFIDRFESKYVIGVLIAVPLFILALILISGYSFAEAFYRGMVLLTVASPCALVASATPATLSAISNGANNGVLFKGGAAMEALSTMNVLYTDKTGTLTFGDFQVEDYVLADDLLKEVIFMEQQSSHPIAEAIVKHFDGLSLAAVNRQEPVKEIAGSGLKKGSLTLGKASAFENFSDPNKFRDKVQAAATTVLVGQKEELVGYFILADQVRKEAGNAVKSFQEAGVDVRLITGDNQAVAKRVADEVNIHSFLAQCLPEDKISLVQKEQGEDQVVGMIGDGINDAPALANADIGIAMGSGSSVAMESSDVVIVQNDLSKLFYSYELSRELNQIIKQNVIFAVSVIVILIILNILGWLDLPLGVVFHEGSTILVILNGLRLLSRKDDKHSQKGHIVK